MPRFIEATDALRVLSEYYNYRTDADNYRLAIAISKVPTADVVEVKHGKWEKMWHSYFKQELPCCSVCGNFSAMRWKYCPECGADMRGGTDG